MQKSILVAMAAVVCTGYLCGKYAGEKKERQKRFKIQTYASVYKMWLGKFQRGESIADFLLGKSYENIAVYGMGKFGVSLINELENRGIKPVFIIDQRADEIFYRGIDVFTLSDTLPDVDAIIVTTVNGQQELKEKVAHYIKCDVYTLEELLQE